MAVQSSCKDSILVDKPFLSTSDAADLFSHLYGMPKATAVKPLDGYDSQNFLLKVENRSSCVENSKSNANGPNVSAYVLKVMSTKDSKDKDGVRAIHLVQHYLKQQGFMCAAPLQNVHGDEMKLQEFTQEEQSEESRHSGKRAYGLFLVRAYPFIHGIPFRNVIPANSTQVFYESGKTLAKLHKILENFPHDIQPLKKKGETFEWSLNQVTSLTRCMDAVTDSTRRNLAIDIVEAFKNKVLTRKDKLRSGIVHSDFSLTNVLLAPDILVQTHGNEEVLKLNGLERKNNYKICGIIDFDDCHYTHLIFDIGASMMYMSVSKAAEDNPLHASGAFLAGYQSINPLTPNELEVLHICQAARYVQSMVLGLYTYTLQPGNEYLLDTQTAWPILDQLWKMELMDIWKMWQDVAAECIQF